MSDNAPTLGELESTEDTIRSVMSELESGDGGQSVIEGQQPEPKVEPKAEEQEPESQPEPKAEEQEPKTDANRDPATGRFTKKAEEQPEEPASPAPAPLEPPVDWSLEQQTAFRALAPEAQKFVMDRVGEFSPKVQEAKETSQKYSGIQQLLDPMRDGWAREGLDEVGGLRQLIGLSTYAGQQPVNFVRWFMQTRGITPQQVFGQPGPQPAQGGGGQQQGTQPSPQPQPSQDPQVARLTQQVEQLVQERQQFAQTQAQQEEVQLQRTLQDFVSQKDDGGQLKHPYFTQVRPMMGALLKSEQAQTLEEAYDMACRAHPEVRAKIEAAQAHAANLAAEEQARKDREKAAAAAKAGSSVSGSEGSGAKAEAESSGDVREDLRRQFRELGML